jgi:RNA 3'-terminal phosphate cyclase (ATP)
MLTIDGRTGGGQVLRTALSLSVHTGTPIELEHIRAARPTPGLRPQHLAVVRVLAELCGGEVDGAEPDATELTFEPGPLAPASMSVDLETAGSVTLLFDAVLPLAARTDAAFELTARGGTDVKWSPTIAYLRRVKLPLLDRVGYHLEVTLDRTGFYPKGGGEGTLAVGPSAPGRLDLADRGALDGIEVFSKASDHLADAEVAERQASRAEQRLAEAELPVTVESVEYVETASPGSSLLLRSGYEESLAGFDALGERGKPSETVADEAVDRLLAFHEGPGVVDRFMADQLLLPLAVSGGLVRAPGMTEHVESSLEVIEQFGFDLAVHDRADGSITIESRP